MISCALPGERDEPLVNLGTRSHRLVELTKPSTTNSVHTDS
jgi:hypothetical protein